jgi:hypothetical protein
MTELCDLFLHEHTGPCADPKHCEALKRRAAGAPKWHAIERRQDGGGYRDFLHGHDSSGKAVPIHCGETLELQAVEYKDDDFGEYMLYLDKGQFVRYEANLSSAEGAITLYASIAGHQFRTRCEPWMRFRWPQ